MIANQFSSQIQELRDTVTGMNIALFMAFLLIGIMFVVVLVMLGRWEPKQEFLARKPTNGMYAEMQKTCPHESGYEGPDEYGSKRCKRCKKPLPF